LLITVTSRFNNVSVPLVSSHRLCKASVHKSAHAVPL